MYREHDRAVLRMLLRTRLNFQSIRKAVDNRLGVKADGSLQNIRVADFTPADRDMFREISGSARDQEKVINAHLENQLEKFGIYNEWLKRVPKGVGPVSAAWIIGEIDIEKATTVSKIWQFCGLNPGLVKGKKSVPASRYEPGMGEIVGELRSLADGEKRICVLTPYLVKGDRLTPGYLCPFNRRLRTALVGVLASAMLKCRSPYALEYYYPCKARLEASGRCVTERKKGGNRLVPWKDCRAGHRDMAARRKMIKAFLADLYARWRAMEGLPVREPYAAEYLGKEHAAA